LFNWPIFVEIRLLLVVPRLPKGELLETAALPVIEPTQQCQRTLVT